MGPEFQFDMAKTVFMLRNADGEVVKTSRKLPDSFFDMMLLADDIYYDGSNNKYWSKNDSPLEYDGKTYIQEEYVDVTNLVLEREQLLGELRKDPLTGISNILAVNKMKDKIIQAENSCLVVMCDVDKFKTINDTYGHQVGDKALIALATLFESSVRSQQDLVGRIGGDEFIFLFPTSNPKVVLNKLLELSAKVKEAGVEFGIPLSISMGAAYFEAMDDFEEVKKHADDAMYFAKKTDGVDLAYFSKTIGDVDVWNKEKNKQLLK